MSVLSSFIESSRHAQGLPSWPDPDLAIPFLLPGAEICAAEGAIGAAYLADGYGPEPLCGNDPANFDGDL